MARSFAISRALMRKTGNIQKNENLWAESGKKRKKLSKLTTKNTKVHRVLVRTHYYLSSWFTYGTSSVAFVVRIDAALIQVNQCLRKLQRLLSDTELHGFAQIFMFSFKPRPSVKSVSNLIDY